MTLRRDITPIIPALRRYAVSLTWHESDGDDLLQATLERALSRQWQYRGGNLTAWLCTIMRSIWLNEIKRRKRYGETLSVVELTGQPYFELDTSLVLNDIDRLLLQQPQLTREIAFLCWVLGCTYKEAAEILDINLFTVRNRLNRLRTWLAHSLSKAELTESKSRASAHGSEFK